MNLFKVTANKELARFFWLQSMTQWIWSAQIPQLVNPAFNKLIADFVKDNHVLIHKCKEILSEKEHSFKLIWDVYLNKNLLNDANLAPINNLLHVFSPVFDIIWESELPQIDQWSKQINADFTEEHQLFIKKVKQFLQSNFAQKTPITIYPLLCSKNLTTSLINKDHPNIILAQHWGCFNNKQIIIKSLMHEYVHMLQNNSKSDEFLRTAFIKVKIPENLKDTENAPPLSYVAREILVQSLVSTELPSYYSVYFHHNNEFSNIHKPQSIKNELNKKTYHDWYSHIRYIAYESQNILNEYMQKEKSIDQEYCDKLAKITINHINNLNS